MVLFCCWHDNMLYIRIYIYIYMVHVHTTHRRTTTNGRCVVCANTTTSANHLRMIYAICPVSSHALRIARTLLLDVVVVAHFGRQRCHCRRRQQHRISVCLLECVCVHVCVHDLNRWPAAFCWCLAKRHILHSHTV